MDKYKKSPLSVLLEEGNKENEFGWARDLVSILNTKPYYILLVATAIKTSRYKRMKEVS